MKRIAVALAALCLVACSGDKGAQGLTGQTGAPGPSGPAGPAGSTGPAGTPAKALRVVTSQEPSGAHCATGGAKLEFGLDQDDSGLLEPSEVDPAQTRYLCNGEVGAAGVPGQSVTATALLPGDANCANGGSAFVSASGTTYVCNGAAGAAGQSVTSATLGPGSPGCANGGSAFTSESGTTYACNGAKGDTGPAGPGFTCANQGAIKREIPTFTVDTSCPALLMGSPMFGSTVHLAGSGSSVILTVENVGGSGTIPMVGSGFISGADGYGSSNDTCSGKTLAVGESCSVTVTKGTSGSASATFEVYSTSAAYKWTFSSP